MGAGELCSVQWSLRKSAVGAAGGIVLEVGIPFYSLPELGFRGLGFRVYRV